MSDRSVVVRLKAEVAGFKAAMAEASAAVKGTKKETEDAGKASDDATKRSVAELAKAAKAHQDAAAAVGLHYDATGKLVTQNGKSVTSQQAAAHGLQVFSAEAYLAGKAAEDTAVKTGGAMARIGASVEKNRDSWEKSGVALLGFGAAALGGVALAVKAFADFDAKMSQVKSLSHASTEDMGTLTEAALTAGGKIGFSAVEVADAEIELVKAGASVKDMMGGALVGALSLAAAGQIDVGKATEIATIAMTEFKLQGKDIPHVADLLAAGADKALGGVQELGDGLKQGGLIASQFGLTIDDTIGTLSAFANAGLLGSDAGTSMKTMFLSLASPSKQAQAALDQYNITAYDSQGKFKGVTELAGQLHDKLGGLSDAQRNAALSTIFGTDAMRAAAVLMSEGRDGIAKWISDVNDQGFAAAQAAGKMDNLNGDVKKLSAAFQTGLIEMGTSADGFVRPVIQGVTDVIHGFNELPEPVKGAMLGMGTVVGVAALAGGAFLTLAPKIFDTVKGFKDLAENGSKIPGVMGSIAKSAGLVAASVALVGGTMKALTKENGPSVEEMANSVLKLSKAGDDSKLEDVFKNWNTTMGQAQVDNVNNLADAVHFLTKHDGYEDFAKSFDGINSAIGAAKSPLGQVEDRIKSLGNTLGTLTSGGSLGAASKGFNTLSDEFVKNGKTAQDALNSVPGYKDALLALAHESKVTLNDQELLELATGKIPAVMSAAEGATTSYTDAAGNQISINKDQSKALAEVGLAADGTVTALDKLVQSLENTGLLQLSANDAARAYQAAIDGVTDSITKNGKTLDITTPKGRENSAAFDGIAKSGLAAAEAMAKNGQSQDDVQSQLGQTYQDLIKAAGQFNITGDEADTMARKALGIPKNVDINTWLHDHASAEIDAIVGKANAANGTTIDIWATIHETTLKKTQEDPGGTGSSIGGRANGSLAGGAATGGHILGGGIGMRAFAGGGQVGFASAGYVQGLGSGTSDSINAWLSNGEFVIRASMVDKYGLGLMDSINSGAFSLGKAYAAPVQQGGGYARAMLPSSGSKTVSIINHIYDQSDPVATAHEVSRRQSSLVP